MTRTLLWIVAGLVLGGIIHLVVILTLPSLSTQGMWSRVSALGGINQVAVLPAAVAGEPNPFALDPDLTYAVCRMDLRRGPAFLRGRLPAGFWSIAVYGPTGTVLYSTTNRDGIGGNLDLGLFNAAQTRLLAQQQLDVAEGLLIVEVNENDVLAVVRLAPPHHAMRARFEAALTRLNCGSLPT